MSTIYGDPIIISSMEGGTAVSVQNTKAVTITSNGIVSVTPDALYDAMKKVDVTVNVASGGGGSAGFKLTFPATATNWNQIGDGFIVQVDGTATPMINYSTLAGKTIPNVAEIICVGKGYYCLRMTVQSGKIIAIHNMGSNVIAKIASDGESSYTPMSNGARMNWIPLADTVISAIEMYNTD